MFRNAGRTLLRWAIFFVIAMIVLSFIFGKGNAFHGLGVVTNFIGQVWDATIGKLIHKHGVSVHTH